MPGSLLFDKGLDRCRDHQAAATDPDHLQLSAFDQAADGPDRHVTQLFGGFLQRPEQGHDELATAEERALWNETFCGRVSLPATRFGSIPRFRPGAVWPDSYAR